MMHLRPTSPPHGGTNYRRHQRHQDQDKPAQIAQLAFIKGERERIWDLRRNPDHLLPTHQPVKRGGNKIEGLLVLRQRSVLNKKSITYYYHARRVHPHPLVPATALFDRSRDR